MLRASSVKRIKVPDRLYLALSLTAKLDMGSYCRRDVEKVTLMVWLYYNLRLPKLLYYNRII